MPDILDLNQSRLLNAARSYQYAGKSSGELAELQEALCLSAARSKCFTHLVSHLCEIDKQSRRKAFS